MNKIYIKEKNISKRVSIPMGDLKPGEIAIIVDSTHMDFGHIVRRSMMQCVFWVEDMSRPELDGGWTNPDCQLQVELLPKAYITVTV